MGRLRDNNTDTDSRDIRELDLIEYMEIRDDVRLRDARELVRDADVMMRRVVTAACLLLLCMCSEAKAEVSDVVLRTIALEAGGESYEGQVAVASVIKTRAAKSGKSAEYECKRKMQFSCWNQGTHRRALTQAEIETARRAWNAAKVWDYTHYATKAINNYWTKTAVKQMTIGNHIFYQLN